ncbi:MAG: hypothetical protein ACYTGZ_10635 [Planctomycetota bacterium]|jgi:hypothetical protein
MKRALDAIASRATEHLRRERIGEAYARAVQESMFLLPAGAALMFVVRVAGAPIGALATIGLALLPYAIGVAAGTARSLFVRIERGTALGRVDRELDLHDRLRTADEFLDAGDRTGFMDAAITDAEPRLAPAMSVALPDRGSRPQRRGPLAATAAFLMVLAALQLAPPPDAADDERLPRISHRTERAGSRSPARGAPDRAERPLADVPPQSESPGRTAEQKESSEQSGAPDKTKRGSAATGRTARTGGTGAQARSADATGAPSAAGRASAKKLDTKPKQSEAKRKKKPKRSAAPPKTPPRRDSGATSGSARSTGSSKNPTVSDWKTRDTPPDQMEDPEADDEQVDDESEDSESRGGMQPNLRSRKPPANRDLSIGFGNRSSQRANGRGGASPPKKSRGTASLVLGVPVPDHIKGQPNPGMTKVTRERGEPEREEADAVRAGARAKRSAPAGVVPRSDPPPWLKELLRRYFSQETEDDS